MLAILYQRTHVFMFKMYHIWLVLILFLLTNMLDSLRYTSALSVGLAVVFVVITAGVTVTKIYNGSVAMPRLLPELVDQTSFFKLFTTVPVLVTAYICHHNGNTYLPSFFSNKLLNKLTRIQLMLLISSFSQFTL